MTIPIKIISKKNFSGKPSQRVVWDLISKPWKTYVVKKIPVVEKFLINKKGVVLDLGCGTGRNMFSFDSLEFVGVDFSKGQLKHAEHFIDKFKINAKLIHSCVEDLSFLNDSSFDYGLFISTLHCIESHNSRVKALCEFFRVLKPGSTALISVWDSCDKRFDSVRSDKDIYMSWREDNKSYMRYYYLFDRQELIDLLKSVGFKILKVYKPKFHDRFTKKNLIIKITKSFGFQPTLKSVGL